MEQTIKIDDLKITYARETAGVVGQRLLLIHGTGCDSRVFRGLSAELSTDHDVVALDLPGHGNSDGSGFRGVADYAAYCVGLVSALGWEDCVVGGHSLGGGVAIAMALYNPELIKGLMIIDSGARLRVSPEVIKMARLIAEGKLKDKGTPRIGFSNKTSSDIVSAVREITMDADPNVTLKDWIADDTCDFMARVGKLDLPTLAVCGREDELTPLKYHEYLSQQMPNCSLRIIDDAGHWSFVEKPREFLEAVRPFLKQLP